MRNQTIAFKLAETGPLGKKGQIISMALTPTDVGVTEELGTFLGGYRNASFRADEVSKVILVDREYDQYRVFTADNTFKKANVNASLSGAVNEVDPESTLSTIAAVHRALGSFVPAITEAQATKLLRPRIAASKRIRNIIDLDREVRVWTALTTQANWDPGNYNAILSGAEWNGGATADPILNLQTAMEASSQEVTDIWMNRKVANTFLRSTKVRDHMRQMLGDSAVSPQVAAAQRADFIIPGLPPIHVVSGKVRNDTTGALGYILGDHVVLTVSPPGVPTDGEDIATMYTWRVRGPQGTGFMTREYFVDARGYAGGTMLVVGHQEDVKFAAPTAGGLIANVIQ